MSKPISKTTLGICLASYTAMQGYSHGGSAVSLEADAVSKAATAIVKSFEASQSLFGEKAAAISC